MNGPEGGKSPARKKGSPGTASPEETICGIATAVGEGGIGIIRISGGGALRVGDRLFSPTDGKSLSDCESHTLHHGTILGPGGRERIDEVMVGLLRAPRSYTREDTVEVYCHGGPLILRRILGLAVAAGARPAEPGEFTKRAFLNGRIDLTRAEAVMDLIRAKSDAAQRAALAQMEGGLYRLIHELRRSMVSVLAEIEAGLDFSEEDIEFISPAAVKKSLEESRSTISRLLQSAEGGRVIREGVRTVIIGEPNVGKSSLMNALLDRDRAITSPVPGTTRDLIEDQMSLDGVLFRLMDTAGLRESPDLIEQKGMDRTRAGISQADMVLVVQDATTQSGEKPEGLRDWKELIKGKRHLLVANKIDLVEGGKAGDLSDEKSMGMPVSAKTGAGLDALREEIIKRVREELAQSGEREALINERHEAALIQAREAVEAALKALGEEIPAEVLALELRRGIDRLGEITGESTSEGLLDQIFKRFCIGK